ncbi:hypothetical protein LSH36_8g03025 [Paralvinella palmiformis]|uniref:Homeobox domain-containing protein n=1 Tax=Paralvinella palmiformis TaxID=53620 RepID=A0AAD9KE31_9ANNE|nr:hypothetical protein LSH36_8g03025 [Paralvinella palmiformis]
MDFTSNLSTTKTVKKMSCNAHFVRPWETSPKRHIPSSGVSFRHTVGPSGIQSQQHTGHVFCEHSAGSEKISSTNDGRCSPKIKSLKSSHQTPMKKISKQNKRYLSPVALDMMESWYEQHFQHPYPSDDVVCYIVRHGKVTPAQVKKWMANKRVRSCNTLSFNGTIHPKRLNRLRKELAASRSQRSTTDDSHSARSLISRPQPIRMTPYPSPYTMPLHTSYMMNYNYLHTQAGGAQPYLWPHVISNDLCRAHSCHRRSLFIDLCWDLIELYSRAFFKEYFFESVLELANDSVPNVRLKLCPLLPKLKQLVKLPADRNLLQLLEQAVRKILVNETDRDVTAAIESAVKLLDEVQVPMDSVGLSNKKGIYADDVADQKKEEEEKQLLEFEEQDRHEEELKSAKGERKKESSNKKDSKIPGPKRGSKIPAATNITKEKISSASSQSRSERSSSFTGGSSAHNHSTKTKRTGSKEDLVSSSRRGGSTSAGTRKTSASGVQTSTVNSSTVLSKGRRASIPNSTLPTEVTNKKGSGPNRKVSVGSVTANGSSPSR